MNLNTNLLQEIKEVKFIRPQLNHGSKKTHNEGKSVSAERFIRTIQNNACKYTTSKSKMCILINQMIQLINISNNK